jgi:2,4-dienoyl-CoA reductase-like NADH-dependent reductase (Old Yellow Enzyme family)
MARLFDPLTIRSVTLRNRVGVSPMQQGVSLDGAMNDWHLAHLGGFAIGGAGLVIGEVTAIDPAGRVTPGDTGIWTDAFVDPLERVARFVSRYGAVFGLQIGHAGRRASCAYPWDGGLALGPEEGGWPVVGPSPLAFVADYAPNSPVPHPLAVDEIRTLVRAFGDGAARARAAGVRWLELHAAHGYLFHAFHSPLSNVRTDAYGGSFDNRIRFTLETVRALRAAWPEELPLSVRISCTEYVDGGWDIDDSIELARRLHAEGVDVIDCSSGAGRSSSGPRGPGYQVPFAERIRRETGIPTATVGMITEPTHADEILYHDRADLVLIGKQFLREPRWVMRAAATLGVPQKLPLPYGHYV